MRTQNHLGNFTLKALLLLVAVGNYQAQGRESNRVEQAFTSLQGELKTRHSQTQAQIHQLQEQKTKLEAKKKRKVEDKKKMVMLKAIPDSGWRLTMKRYKQVLTVRYVDKEGRYQRGLAVSQTDRRNLNDLFQRYFDFAPFEAHRTSAGEAERLIEWALDESDDRSGKRKDPRKKYRAEQEILKKELKDYEKRTKVVRRLAKRLGIGLP